MPRYASIWFPYLLTEYRVRKTPSLQDVAFVLASSQRGRMVIDSANRMATQKGIRPGMVLADCKAIFPELQALKSEPGKTQKLLAALADWCIAYTPIVAVDLPDGLILDTTGCPHLWGGEPEYLESLKKRLASYGYTVRAAMADTIGAAWAMARFGKETLIVKPGGHRNALRTLPAAALRLEPEILDRLKKLGLHHIESFMDMPTAILRRRFGPSLSFRIGQAFGTELEMIVPVKPVEPYQERLCSMEPIAHATGIKIALTQLAETLCRRFADEGMGLRYAIFKGFRVDGDIQQIEIGTSYPSRNANHLCRLFEDKIATLKPALGFEVFVLEASKVESITDEQAAIWNSSGHSDKKVSELLDRIAAKTNSSIIRYLPAQHYWPERSVRKAVPLWEKKTTGWQTDSPRPVHLLAVPESIEVSAVLPDYPPMLFRYKGELYTVVRSDGPERIEQEWWIADGLYRDYYCIEDENGSRYWLFRSGPYHSGRPEWFIHGFFS